jgi:hypothetical protein
MFKAVALENCSSEERNFAKKPSAAENKRRTFFGIRENALHDHLSFTIDSQRFFER